jgi:hypothetical protein
VFGIANRFDDSFCRFGHSVMCLFSQIEPCIKTATGFPFIRPARRPVSLIEARGGMETSFSSLDDKSSDVFTRRLSALGVPRGIQGEVLWENTRIMQGNSFLPRSECGDAFRSSQS